MSPSRQKQNRTFFSEQFGPSGVAGRPSVVALKDIRIAVPGHNPVRVLARCAHFGYWHGITRPGRQNRPDEKPGRKKQKRKAGEKPVPVLSDKIFHGAIFLKGNIPPKAKKAVNPDYPGIWAAASSGEAKRQKITPEWHRSTSYTRSSTPDTGTSRRRA